MRRGHRVAPEADRSHPERRFWPRSRRESRRRAPMAVDRHYFRLLRKGAMTSGATAPRWPAVALSGPRHRTRSTASPSASSSSLPLRIAHGAGPTTTVRVLGPGRIEWPSREVFDVLDDDLSPSLHILVPDAVTGAVATTNPDSAELN